MKKAVVLLSGGLDSATTLYLAKKEGFVCHALVFDYGQRHKKEIRSAKAIAQKAGVEAKVLKISLPWKGSSLLDKGKHLPGMGERSLQHIPSTYVPARNIIFLSFALSYAEAIGAKAIFIGAHAHDYSGYPDCRPSFFHAFSEVIAQGTKAGVQHEKIRIDTPLIGKTKAEIIRMARRLKVPLGLTWSCYRGGKRPCGECDSCYFRLRGFHKLGIKDPLFMHPI